MKTRLATALGLFALLAGVVSPAHAEAKYKIKWLLGHKNLDYFEEAAANFKKVVETGSHGDIAVTIVTQANDAAQDPAAQRSSPEIAAMVAKGEAEMGHSFTDVMGGLEPKMYAFETPFLFRDYRHMEGVFEGPLGEEMLDGLRAQHIVGLSFTYSGGATGVATTDRVIRGPEDMKGLKVGVFGDAVNEAWLSGLGAVPVRIEHNLEGILPGAQAGKMDAVAVTWRNFERATLNQGFKYYNMPASTYLVSVTYINEKFYEGLPAEYRKLIKDASHEAGITERAKTIELNEAARREMLGKGVRPTYLTQVNRARFGQALKPAYAKIEAVVGKEFIERIRKTADAPAHPEMARTVAANR
jgi:TRAP-type C4-dicarboxylate transport system substrate-binding protein